MCVLVLGLILTAVLGAVRGRVLVLAGQSQWVVLVHLGGQVEAEVTVLGVHT